MTRLLLAFLCVVVTSASAGAAGDAYYLEQIRKVNEDVRAGRVSYTDIRQVMGRRIVDETNRVVGEVEDIVMNDRGNVEHIVLDLNGHGDTPLHPRHVKMYSDTAYQLAFHRDDVGRFMAEIEPASGADGALRGRDLLGARVIGVSGERFGTVQGALLNSANTSVYAVTIRGSKGHVGNLVLPVNRGMRTGPGRVVLLNSAYSAALNEYLRGD